MITIVITITCLHKYCLYDSFVLFVVSIFEYVYTSLLSRIPIPDSWVE